MRAGPSRPWKALVVVRVPPDTVDALQVLFDESWQGGRWVVGTDAPDVLLAYAAALGPALRAAGRSLRRGMLAVHGTEP